MKTHLPAGKPRGFTLIELLVVIAIISVLAAMGFGAFQKATNRAKGMKTLADANALVEAVMSFNNDYGRLPDVAMQGDDFMTEGPAGQELLTVLTAKEAKGSDMQNPRQSVYLSIREAQVKANGGLYFGKESGLPEALYDAWGNAMHVRFDDDLDGEVPDPLNPGKFVRNQPVIVYSYGADEKPGGGDDIKTW
ncbi:prepilin-type N-terminal cleavage/methylation domain-containing protein [Luteolibacter marinus]|uniref:prepilin-type N-terminal cleavage/methylation domain-containing protein n=1 Tax=Luteolibacter marinus TaxID=2776705 RepID=UPI0018668574|nr:prepilin-type N-terminal cleavage/methylation domain-containing protein [Luteolibacter marinus]